MKLGELLDSIVVVNHEWNGRRSQIFHLDLWGSGPLRDFEVEDFLIGNAGGDGFITAHGEKKREGGEGG